MAYTPPSGSPRRRCRRLVSGVTTGATTGRASVEGQREKPNAGSPPYRGDLAASPACSSGVVRQQAVHERFDGRPIVAGAAENAAEPAEGSDADGCGGGHA
ncbi:hypothetical protein GCM10023238_31590 [Streptomyces heliomycini]